MPIVDLAETYSWRLTVTDAAGAPGAPGATPTVTVTLPDGTPAAAPTVTPNGLGIYDVDYLTVVTGLHSWVGTATGGVLGAAVRKWGDQFDVDNPAETLISTTDAIAHLRGAGLITTAADLEQLRWLCSVASEAVEGDTGITFRRRTIVETYDGGCESVTLRQAPVLSVTTVTQSGVALTGSDYRVRPGGVLTRVYGEYAGVWFPGVQNITVTYVAGYTNPPRIARKVALNAVQRMWQSSQQMPHPAFDFGGQAGLTGENAVSDAIGHLTPLEYGAYLSLSTAGSGV